MNESDPQPGGSTSSPPEKPDDLNALLAGAAVVAVVPLIPYANLLCCLPSIGGALLAVHLYTRAHGLTLAPSTGLKLGSLTCLLGGMFYLIAYFLLLRFFDYLVGEAAAEWIAEIVAEHVDPQVAAQILEDVAKQKATALTPVAAVLTSIYYLFWNAVSGCIGGAAGAALFKRAPAPDDAG